MGPFWKRDETGSRVYHRVQRHSPGMVSVVYVTPTDSTRELVKKFKTFRKPTDSPTATVSGASDEAVQAGPRPGSTKLVKGPRRPSKRRKKYFSASSPSVRRSKGRIHRKSRI